MKINKCYRIKEETIKKLERRKKERGINYDKLFELLLKALDKIEKQI